MVHGDAVMSANEYPILGIDIGSTNIKCAMGVLGTNYIDIIAANTLPTLGIRDGLMEDSHALVDVIKQSIKRTVESASCEPKEALFCISSRHFYSVDTTGEVSISAGHVTHNDVLKVIEVCHKNTKVTDEHGENAFTISHTLPQRFYLDNNSASLSPWGQPALRMKVDAHLVYGQQRIIDEYWRVGAKVDLPMKDIVCDLLVQAEGLLTKSDLERHVAILDLGSETTKIMIFDQGAPVYFRNRFQGGIHLTREIKDQLGVSFDDAETLKIRYANVSAEASRDQSRIPIHTDAGPKRYIRREKLRRIIETELKENLSAIKVRLEKDRASSYLNGGIILSGGGANIKGLTELASEVLQCNVRVGRPQNPGTTDLVQAPQYAAVNGLVLSGLRGRYDQWYGIWRRDLKDIPSPKKRQRQFQSRTSFWKRLMAEFTL